MLVECWLVGWWLVECWLVVELGVWWLMRVYAKVWCWVDSWSVIGVVWFIGGWCWFQGWGWGWGDSVVGKVLLL